MLINGKNGGGNIFYRRVVAFNTDAETLVQMARSGQDVYASLPVLSTWLGHQSFSSTEKYVRLVEDMYPDIIGQSASVSAYVFPKTTLIPELP